MTAIQKSSPIQSSPSKAPETSTEARYFLVPENQEDSFFEMVFEKMGAHVERSVVHGQAMIKLESETNSEWMDSFVEVCTQIQGDELGVSNLEEDVQQKISQLEEDAEKAVLAIRQKKLDAIEQLKNNPQKADLIENLHFDVELKTKNLEIQSNEQLKTSFEKGELEYIDKLTLSIDTLTMESCDLLLRLPNLKTLDVGTSLDDGEDLHADIAKKVFSAPCLENLSIVVPRRCVSTLTSATFSPSLQQLHLGNFPSYDKLRGSLKTKLIESGYRFVDERYVAEFSNCQYEQTCKRKEVEQMKSNDQ